MSASGGGEVRLPGMSGGGSMSGRFGSGVAVASPHSDTCRKALAGSGDGSMSDETRGRGFGHEVQQFFPKQFSSNSGPDTVHDCGSLRKLAA
jgi:hypothetical protein